MYKYFILKFRPDSNITDGPVDRCKEKDCLTTFRSKAGADCHYALLHNRNTPGVSQRLQVCKFPGCNKGFPSLYCLTQHKKEDKHQKKDETRGRKPLPPRFDDEEDEVDDIDMGDVPENESTQTTDQFLGLPDIEGEEDGGSEEAAIEPVAVTRKRGRPRKPLSPRFVVEEDE